jgi:ribosomal protein S18 acetylase RimI-like enzyme
MDNEIAELALVGQTRQRPHIAQDSLPPKDGASVEERRGEAMRGLFPMHAVGRARERESGVARQVYAYLAEATTNEDLERRVRFPRHYPTQWIQRVWLRDRRSVLVRPVLPTDAAMLQSFVRSMSPTTRRNRFHGAVADLPEHVMRYMTEVDYVSHLAFIGEVSDRAEPRQVAEARWVRRMDEPDHADFAIAIDDTYQFSGLGTRLMDMLERSAAAKDIRRLCGYVLTGNQRMIGWLESQGWTLQHDRYDPSVVQVELPLPRHRQPEVVAPDQLAAAA